MAGNENSGRKPTFAMKEADLAEHIKMYKAAVDSGEIARASWPHFCATLDCTEEELAVVMAQPDWGAYSGRARLLKKMLTWVRGQMLSANGWNGQLTSRAIFALKQDNGDGVAWRDYSTNANTGPGEMKIRFASGDPRAKEAGK